MRRPVAVRRVKEVTETVIGSVELSGGPTPPMIRATPPATTSPDETAGGEGSTRLRAASQEFEALFWEQVLRAALPPDRLIGSDTGAGVYVGLVESGLADAAANAGGAGLWRLLVQSLQLRGAAGHAP